MHGKLIVLTLVMLAMLATLLALRHQRLQLSNQVVQQHMTAQRLARDLWQVQADAATLLTPQNVRDRIDRARLAMEPATPRLDTPAATDFARADRDALP
jgi:hypothetical protein